MQLHIRILGASYVIVGAMGVMAAAAVLALFGGYAGLAGADYMGADAGIGRPIAIVLLIFSVPGVIGGIGLLCGARWSRVFMIATSALHLLHIPIGTPLGVYGLWALTRADTAALLGRPATAASTR